MIMALFNVTLRMTHSEPIRSPEAQVRISSMSSAASVMSSDVGLTVGVASASRAYLRIV